MSGENALPAEAPHAFFSYSREDSEFALRLAADLKAAGASVWIDQLDIGPGERWDLTVQVALENCPCMLVILTPASVSSNNVLDEVSFALDKKKTVIPVLYRDCEIPFRIMRLQHVDFRTDYQHMLQELLKALHISVQAQTSTVLPANTVAERAPVPREEASKPTPGSVASPRVQHQTTPIAPKEPTVDRRPARVEPTSPPSFGQSDGSSSGFPAWAKIAVPIVVLAIAIGVYLMMSSGGGKQSKHKQEPPIQPADNSTGENTGKPTFELTGSAIAHAQTSPPCSLPAASESDFTIQDPAAWFFFAYRRGEATDQWTVEWVEPNGYVHKTDTVANPEAGGRYCFQMKIAGSPAQKAPGEWVVRLNRNGVQVAEQRFRISR